MSTSLNEEQVRRLARRAREAHGNSALQALCGVAEDGILASLRTLRAARGLEEETTTIRSSRVTRPRALPEEPLR